MSEQQVKTVAKRTRRAVVLSNGADKTVVVEVTRRIRHRKYNKFVKRRIRYAAHDEGNTCNVGDVVVIEETRPLSKTKRWRVRDIVEAADLN